VPAPSSPKKVERIAEHIAALSLDLREWVELRIELAKTEVRETIDETKARVTAEVKAKGTPIAITVGIGSVGVLFLLYGMGFLFGAMAQGVGELLGHEWLGSLLTASFLFVVAIALLLLARRRLYRASAIEANARVDEPPVSLRQLDNSDTLMAPTSNSVHPSSPSNV